MATNPINYASYNFEDAVLQLQNWLKAKNTWKDAYRSGTGQMMAEFYGALANLIMYYQERAAQELYLPTARNKSSVINLVALLGYKPKRPISAYTADPTSGEPVNATVALSIATALGSSNSLSVPKFTKLTTTSGIQFLTRTAIQFTGSATSQSVDVIQGQLQEPTYTSDGSANQEYQVQFTNVENTSINVIVAGVLWDEVDSFLLGTPSSKWYKVIPNLDDTLTVQFGDKVSGQAPSSNDSIVIQFILSDGSAGNVYAAGVITTVSPSSFTDALGNKVEVTVTNTDAVLGGADAEDIEEIRYEAPRVFQTGDRAVTKEDFKSILLNASAVDIASSNAWGENEETPPNYDMFNRVKICVILTGWNLLSDSMKTTLGDYLYTKSLITVKYTFVDPDIVEVIPTLDLKIIKGYNLTAVHDDVDDAITARFVLGTTTVLGTPQRIGDIVASVEGVAGVSYSHVELMIYRPLAIITGDNYGVTLPLLPVKHESVQVYAQVSSADTLVAQDNGAGTFVAESGYTVTGTVDYVSGVVDVTVTSPDQGPSDVVSVRYLQDQSGDVVVGQNQAVKLRFTNVTSYTYE